MCLVIQDSSNYTSFTEPFDLNFGSDAMLVNLTETTRNTLVIIEKMGKPTYVKVRGACGGRRTAALWDHHFLLLN